MTTPSRHRLELSRRAERDLRGILQWTLQTWGEEQRDLYAAAIDAALADLTLYPELGRA